LDGYKEYWVPIQTSLKRCPKKKSGRATTAGPLHFYLQALTLLKIQIAQVMALAALAMAAAVVAVIEVFAIGLCTVFKKNDFKL
jgi:hypothetical protein